jgi:hypothetical protein
MLLMKLVHSLKLKRKQDEDEHPIFHMETEYFLKPEHVFGGSDEYMTSDFISFIKCSDHIDIRYPVLYRLSLGRPHPPCPSTAPTPYALPQLDMHRQRDRRPEDLTAPHTSCRLTSVTSNRVPLERVPTSPASIAALAAHVLEAEVGGPDVVGDVLDVDPVAGSEVGSATRARAGAEAPGPSTEDATRAVRCGVFVDGDEVLAEDELVDGDVLVAVVDHATHDGRRDGVGSRL